MEELTFKEVALLIGEYILIIMGMLVLLWAIYRYMAQEGGWKEYLSRLTLKNPVPLLTALGFGAIFIVGFLMIKGLVMYLNQGGPQKPPPENPAAAALHLPAKRP